MLIWACAIGGHVMILAALAVSGQRYLNGRTVNDGRRGVLARHLLESRSMDTRC
ncbi:MAG: hypothetical protein RL885_26870 [Planctomycetota bacterium]